MIQANSLFPQFSAGDFSWLVQQYEGLNTYTFRNIFEREYTADLTIGSIQANFGAIASADVVAFDSTLAVKDRPKATMINEEIPKVGISFRKKETDFITYKNIEYRAAMGRNANTAKALLDFLYNDAKHCIDGMDNKMEYMSKQILSSGGVTFNVGNNADGIDRKIKFNTTSVAKEGGVWSNPTTAKPITTFKKVIQEATKVGRRITNVFMSPAEFGNFIQTDEVKALVTSFLFQAMNVEQNLTLETVNRSLAANGLPQITVLDSFCTTTTKASQSNVVTGWTAGMVTFTTSPNPGAIMWTDTVDAFRDDTYSTKQARDYMLIKSYGEDNPPTLITMGVAYAMPVLKDAEGTFIVNTL